jgi:hypothetical protein
MKPKTMAIIEALCCENLSEIEVSMVFGCSVDKIHSAICEAMQVSGNKRHDLWQLLGTPKIEKFKPQKSIPILQVAAKVFISRVEARDQYFRRSQD